MLNVPYLFVSNWTIKRSLIFVNTEGIREERNKKVAGLMKYFGISMSLFYIMISVLVSFTGLFEGIHATTKYLFSAMLFIYGCFRFYRVFAQPK